MSKNNIHSLEAEKIWLAISKDLRNQILANVWCGDCKQAVSVLDYKITTEESMLVIRGFCLECGAEVARVVD